MAKPTKMEFVVNMTCQSCVDSITNVLKGHQGVQSHTVNVNDGRVLVETNLPAEDVKSLIESTGRVAALIGTGEMGSGVAALSVGSDRVKGIVRLVQVEGNQCMFDGTVDGLPHGRHCVCVHEAGDVSDGCDSCGEVLGAGSTKKARGVLTELEARSDGRSQFRIVSGDLSVSELIGRSIIIHKGSQPGSDTRLVCGIIARSAQIFQNTKRFCACDGVSIWDSRTDRSSGKTPSTSSGH